MKRENDKSAPGTALFNWYPGHMAKALREIKQRLPMVDVVIEIRDARIPLASGNPELKRSIGQKNHLIVLNKANLADPAHTEIWEKWFEQEAIDYMFVDCFDKTELRKAITKARKKAEATRLLSDPDTNPQRDKLKLMIVGLPNTGKSTIINQLAGKNAAKVADKPGLTTIQQWIKIDNEIELLDTPGIMPPFIESKNQALWLSAIHALPDDIADEEDTAWFLMKHFLEQKSPQFMERYKLDSFDKTLDEVILAVATVRGALRQKGMPDNSRVYKIVLADFREGLFGRTSFGKPPKLK